MNCLTQDFAKPITATTTDEVQLSTAASASNSAVWMVLNNLSSINGWDFRSIGCRSTTCGAIDPQHQTTPIYPWFLRSSPCAVELEYSMVSATHGGSEIDWGSLQERMRVMFLNSPMVTWALGWLSGTLLVRQALGGITLALIKNKIKITANRRIYSPRSALVPVLALNSQASDP